MRGLSLLFLGVLVAASLGSAWAVRGLVREQEEGLLRERGAEVNLVLGSLISSVQNRLNLIGTVARISNGSPQSFAEVAGWRLDQPWMPCPPRDGREAYAFLATGRRRIPVGWFAFERAQRIEP